MKQLFFLTLLHAIFMLSLLTHTQAVRAMEVGSYTEQKKRYGSRLVHVINDTQETVALSYRYPDSQYKNTDCHVLLSTTRLLKPGEKKECDVLINWDYESKCTFRKNTGEDSPKITGKTCFNNTIMTVKHCLAGSLFLITHVPK